MVGADAPCQPACRLLRLDRKTHTGSGRRACPQGPGSTGRGCLAEDSPQESRAPRDEERHHAPSVLYLPRTQGSLAQPAATRLHPLKTGPRCLPFTSWSSDPAERGGQAAFLRSLAYSLETRGSDFALTGCWCELNTASVNSTERRVAWSTYSESSSPAPATNLPVTALPPGRLPWHTPVRERCLLTGP